MRAHFEYNLPEEQDEFDIHMKASSFHTAVYEYDQWLRSICKHGNPEEYTAEGCRAKLWEFLNQYGVSV